MPLSKASFACVIFVSLAGPAALLADSFSVTTDGSYYQPRSGPTYCHDSGSSSASCSIEYELFNGHLQGGASAQAMGTFGSLSGNAEGGGDNLIPKDLSYSASFSRYATVTGATGNGTLISHYQLTAFGDAVQTGETSYAAANAPSFYFAQGSERTNFVPVLDVTGNCQSNYGNACYSGIFNVTSPLTFGAPLALGAQTEGPGSGDPVGSELVNSSTVDLTGYTVLDSAGNVVADATVTPGAAGDFDFFVPEPSSIGLALLGLAALFPALKKRNRSNC